MVVEDGLTEALLCIGLHLSLSIYPCPQILAVGISHHGGGSGSRSPAPRQISTLVVRISILHHREFCALICRVWPDSFPGPRVSRTRGMLVFSTNLHHPLNLSTNKPPHFCRHYVELSPHHHRHHLLVIQFPTDLQRCLESVRKTHKERPSRPSARRRAPRL